MTFIEESHGCVPALEAAKELEEMAEQILNRDSLSAQKLRRQAENIRAVVSEFDRLREAVYPGLPPFEPTAEKPQEDFFILMAEGMRRTFDTHAELLAVCRVLRDRLKGFIGSAAEITDCSDDMAAVIVADEVIRKAEEES